MNILNELFPGPDDNIVFVMLIVGLLILRVWIAEEKARREYYRNRYPIPPRNNDKYPPWM